MTSLRMLTLACMLTTGACSGEIQSPSGEPPAVGPAPPVTPERCDELGPQAGLAPMRRLSAESIGLTLQVLFGEADTEAIGALRGNAGGEDLVGVLDVERQLAFAERVGQVHATALACDAPPCTETIRAFGRRVWRRPLEADELEELLALPSDEARVTRLFASPSFHHIPEPVTGEPGTVVPLDGFARATRLSFALTGAGPDETLLDAAEAGALDDAEGVRALAAQLLDSPEGRAHTRGFFLWWLGAEEVEGLEKDRVLFPDWTPRIAALFRLEVEAFADHLLASNGRFAEVVASPAAWLNDELAAYHGVPGVRGGAFREVAAPGRGGLLGSGAFTAIHARSYETSPLHRGIFVREVLFCGSVGDPPDGVDIEAPDPDPNLTTRERLAEHRADPACATCHDYLDPPGFAFEHFGPDGRVRDDEHGLPIDATGVLLGTDVDGPFDGLAELADRVAGSAMAQRCFSRHWLRYLRQTFEGEHDECAIGDGYEALNDGGIRELMLALTSSDAFLMRRVDEEGMDR